MIVISGGMPRAGTGWFYNLTNDLLVACGYQDARAVRDRYRLHKVLLYHNCNIGRFTPHQAARVLLPHLLGNRFVVKTHHLPSPAMRWLTRLGVARPTYIYRDPRDVVLSSIEMGRKLRARGLTHTFAQHETFADHVDAVARWCQGWERWQAFPGVHMVRYEALKADPHGELRRLATFLGLAPDDATLRRVHGTYEESADETRMLRYSHKNQGVVGRSARQFSAEQMALCDARLGHYIAAMGYDAVAPSPEVS